MKVHKIQFTKGCPNGCSYCYEPKEVVDLNFRISNFKKSDYYQILDMNFLSNPNALEILKALPKGKYEFVCGVDYRILTQEHADLMKAKGFKKVRWAWDYGLSLQYKHKDTYNKFLKAGYKPKDLSVFILVNWKIPFMECFLKMELLKIWGVKIDDCCFNGGYKLAKPKDWGIDEIRFFKLLSSLHNQATNFKIYPDLKRALRLKRRSINNLLKHIKV